jgi:hypothetical protein
MLRLDDEFPPSKYRLDGWHGLFRSNSYPLKRSLCAEYNGHFRRRHNGFSQATTKLLVDYTPPIIVAEWTISPLLTIFVHSRAHRLLQVKLVELMASLWMNSCQTTAIAAQYMGQGNQVGSLPSSWIASDGALCRREGLVDTQTSYSSSCSHIDDLAGCSVVN